MPLYIQIIIDVAVFWFFFGNYIQKYCQTPLGKRKYQLKEMEKFLRNLYLRDKDILASKYVSGLESAIREIHDARTSGNADTIQNTLMKYQNNTSGHALTPPRKNAWMSEHLEILVVALGLAFGVRSLFIQPFKIPTGSMQPTLYGIHFVPSDSVPQNKLAKFFSYLNFSRQNYDVVARKAGRFDWNSLRPGRNYLPLYPSTEFLIGTELYRVPGSVSEVQRTIYEYFQDKASKGPLRFRQGDLLMADANNPLTYARQAGELDWSSLKEAENSTSEIPRFNVAVGSEVYTFTGYPEDIKRQIIRIYINPLSTHYFDVSEGDVFIRGFLETGDHLFVNRLSLAFKEPKRGDVMVFTTDDLDDPDGTGFGGRYYVKRLVGLPGDTLKIIDRKLYVKQQDEADFRLLDARDNPGFERIYSETGAYHGYAHMPPPALHLTSNNAEMEVPEGHYVMLGDNSENSKDSRYWGTVPRKNLVGSPGIVWWPLSRRWGLVDRIEPDPAIGPTPANYPIRKQQDAHP